MRAWSDTCVNQNSPIIFHVATIESHYNHITLVYCLLKWNICEKNKQKQFMQTLGKFQVKYLLLQ